MAQEDGREVPVRLAALHTMDIGKTKKKAAREVGSARKWEKT